MKRFFSAMLLAGSMAFPATAQDLVKTYNVINPNAEAWQGAPVEIGGIEGFRSALVKVDGKEVPCQMDDLDGDGGADHLFFLTDIKGKDRQTVKVSLWRKGEPRNYKARTFADIILPNSKIKIKNKQNVYLKEFTVMGGSDPFRSIHQHGVVFESELTAFRIYCSPRQTVDLYGKYKRQLELKESEFYPDKDQLAKGFGDDVLLVGDGVGLGALNGWNGTEPVAFTNCESRSQRIITTGPLRSIVEIVDKNWRPTTDAEPFTLTTRYTILAGHRDCKVDVQVSVPKGFTLTNEIKKTPYYIGITNVRGSKSWTNAKGLLASWGSDYPAKGDTTTQTKQTVGLAVCIPAANLEKRADTKYDYGYVVKIPQGHLTYAISFCSDKEKDGYHSEDAWKKATSEWERDLQKRSLIILKK